MLRNLLTVFCLGIAAIANAQITFVSTDLPTPAATLVNAVDTVPVGFTAGPKGANQTWNFSGLVQDIVENVTHAIPTNTPYSADFPGTTHAITPDNVNFGYFTNTSSAFTAKGLAGPLLGPGTNPVSVQFNPTFDLYRFPTNYNNAFSGNYGFVEEASGSSVGQPVDRVRLTFTATYTDTIDAWGTIITPTGSYQALRQKRVEQTRALVEFKLLSFSPWATAEDIRDTTVTYTWIAKETKGPVLAIAYNTNTGAISRITYSLTPPAPVADFSWTNPSGGLVQFTDQSTNGPTSWSWDYDDGSALGTTQNPNHVYAANGTYNVCLTASNNGGSDTYCENVTVTNISAGNNAPVAANDRDTVDVNTAFDIPVLDNDLDPDGDDITVTAFGLAPSNGTVVINPDGSITYTPDSTFIGVDSFSYVICDDGTPSLCDTALVYVAVNNVLQADLSFGFGNDSCLFVTVYNASIGYTGLVSWTFGDGGTGIGETVSHDFDTAGYYLICVSVSDGISVDSACANYYVNPCDTTGLITIDALALQVYPNPAQNQLTVVVPNGNKGGKLAIINNLGIVVKEVEVTNSRTTITIADLAAGIYHLAYTGQEGTLGAGRFVKE